MLGFFTVKAKSSFLYTRYKMEEPSNKYILLRDSVGRLALEKNWLTLGLTMKSTPTQVLRGELLEGVPEAEQPTDSTKVAAVGIERKSLCLECPTEDVARLSEEETNLLLAITSSEGRFQTFIDRKLMVFGRQLSLGSTVFVEVKAHSNVLPGIVWYKGVLPPRLGTWFGVELTKHPGSGTCDGTFGKKQYFTCQPDSGVFVGLDKLTPREDEGDLKSLKIAKKVATKIDGTKITVQPGLSNGDRNYTNCNYQNTTQEYDEYVNIDKDGCETWIRKYERQEESKEHVRPATYLTSHRLPKSKDEVKQLEQGAHRNNGSVVTAKYVSDRKSSEIAEAMEVEIFFKDPSKKLYAHSNASTLLRNDFAVNKGTGDSGNVSVENHFGMEIGSMIEVPMADGVPRYGVIRWVGNIPQVEKKLVAGLELEEEESACSDGTFNKERYFTCPKGRGFFVLLENCRPDSRFANSPTTDVCLNAEKDRRLMEENEPGGNVHRLVRELEEQVTDLQAELREKELRETSLHEQPKKKEQLEETSRKQSAEIEQQLTNLRDVTQQMTIVQGQLQEKNEETANLQNQATVLRKQLEGKDQEIDELEKTLSTAQDELRACQRQLIDVTQQMTIVRGQLQEKNEETANLQDQATALMQQLEEKDQEMNELETTLSTAQDELCEYQRQQSPEWVISRDHIQLTDRFLGRGGWGSVVEGKYCGCSVAVKQIHELILSPHNRKLFEREMDIASRCRHPCLLQFIGATNDEGNPLFVTELMETSLRTLLEQRALSEAELSFIFLDVARALNYLHQKQPSPIIHRDISSANVLLWRQGEHWRGKVSDYGTAKFMQQTMTVAPGAMIYSPPEALTKNQTVKVDVYSFGVLLCEMCIRELPNPERRDRQVAMVKNKLNRALIRKCLQREPEARPSVQEIIDEREQSNKRKGIQFWKSERSRIR